MPTYVLGDLSQPYLPPRMHLAVWSAPHLPEDLPPTPAPGLSISDSSSSELQAAQVDNHGGVLHAGLWLFHLGNPSASPTDCVFTLPAPGSPQPPADRLLSAQQPQRPCLPLKLPPWVPEGLPREASLLTSARRPSMTRGLTAFISLPPHPMWVPQRATR